MKVGVDYHTFFFKVGRLKAELGTRLFWFSINGLFVKVFGGNSLSCWEVCAISDKPRCVSPNLVFSARVLPH